MRKFFFKTLMVSLIVSVGLIFPFDGYAQSEEDVAQLTYWSMDFGPNASEAVEKLVTEFSEKHPKIEVEYETIPWAGYYEEFMTSVTSGAAPDVATGPFGISIQFAEMGEILPLGSLVEKLRDEGYADNLIEGAIENHKYEGEQVSIQVANGLVILMYREDIFKEAGVSEVPRTWDEFLSACERIKQNTDVYPFVYAGGGHQGTAALLSFLFSNGTGIVNEEGQANFDSEEAVETLSFFGEIYKKGYVPEGVNSYGQADAARMYFAGDAAMRFMNISNRVMDHPKVAENSGVLPILKGPSAAEQRTFSWRDPVFAFKQTDHPEAARTFIEYLIKNKGIFHTMGEKDALPADKQTLDLPMYDHEENFVYAEAIEKVMPHAKPLFWPLNEHNSGIATVIGENYLGRALQEVNTQEEVDYEAIAEKYNEFIKEALS